MDTEAHTQCYGNDHIPEQCWVPDPAVRGAINRGVSAEARPLTLPTPGLSLLSVRPLSPPDLWTLPRQQRGRVRALIPNHTPFSPPAVHTMTSACARCYQDVCSHSTSVPLTAEIVSNIQTGMRAVDQDFICGSDWIWLLDSGFAGSQPQFQYSILFEPHWQAMSNGVPQEPVLGPILFSAYMLSPG